MLVPAGNLKYVTKKDGREEIFSEEKLYNRAEALLEGLEKKFMALDECIKKVTKYAQSGE
jgi:transcriptional regulator NrdR family protein